MADQPVDIRTVSPEEYWSVFERQWTSLLSYRYLGRVSGKLDTNEGAGRMLLRSDMRNRQGGVMAAPLCIFAPESGGMADDQYVPNPVIASMQVLDDARDVQTVRGIPETVRIGRQMGFSRTLIVDDLNPSRVVAISEGMGISLGATPGGYQRVDNQPIAIADSPDLPPLHEVFGATCDPGGVWRLPKLSIETASPDAALHLGPQHIVLETAAVDAATRLAGVSNLQVLSYHCMFAARGKVGPFRVLADPYEGGSGKVGVRLTLRDEGNDDRAITSASILFQVATNDQ